MKDANRTKCIIALAKAYEQKDTTTIDRIEKVLLPQESTLPQELQEVLNTWGYTPIEEPEFFELLYKEGTTLEQVQEAAAKNINTDDYNAVSIAILASEVRKKIENKTDKDGIYKTTPAIDRIKLPKVSQIKTLKKIANTEDITDQQLNEEIFKIAEVKEKDISKWEADLIVDMYLSYIRLVDSGTIGAIADISPFTRYLKN